MLLTSTIHEIHTPLTLGRLLTRAKKEQADERGVGTFNLSLYYVLLRGGLAMLRSLAAINTM